jgi:hypothetical protein
MRYIEKSKSALLTLTAVATLAVMNVIAGHCQELSISSANVHEYTSSATFASHCQ